MSAHPPPVPPEQRAPHGSADADPAGGKTSAHEEKAVRGPTANVAQNTHNKGHQQDR